MDTCCGEALRSHKLSREEIVYTKTLYNYITLGLLGVLKSIELPLRVTRKNKKHKTRERKKKLERSIEERDASVKGRQEFGNWECDLRARQRSNNESLPTLVGRKTRCSLLRKLPNKESASIMEAFRVIRDELVAGCFDKEFLTITTDNESVFARLSELEEGSNLRVYHARPHCSSNKGTNEKHNGLFRRFILKGKRIPDYPTDYIERVQQWANTLPRKILGYKSPEECFS